MALFHDYDRELAGAGYNRQVARLHLHTVAHFGVWLQLAACGLKTVDEENSVNIVPATGSRRP